MRRLIPLLLALVVLAVACGADDPFAGLGDFSRDFVHGDTTSTSLVNGDLDDGDDVLPEGTGLTVDVEWTNDEIAATIASSREEVVSDVWTRGGGEAFVQATRREIAAALPGVEFPELVPDEVGWITSQLVYETSSASLDVETATAFGLWAYEPYTVTRGQGQVAVLRIGILGPDSVPAPIAAEPVDEGLSLTWASGLYSYRLFCRTGVSDALCWQMAETAAPLELLLPSGA